MTADVLALEAELERLYQEYCNCLDEAVSYLSSDSKNINPRRVYNDTHKAATIFFNRFDSSLDDYSSSDVNHDQAIRKAEDTINVIPLIFNHWRVIRTFCNKYNLPVPEPSPTAYGSIQRIIKKFYPEEIQIYKKQFEDMNLPTAGFDSKTKHTGWKKRAPVEIIIGLVIFIGSGILNFSFNDPTGSQFIFLKLAMAIGGSVTLMGLGHSFIKVKWTMTNNFYVIAGGTVGLFILLYFLNPPPPPEMKNNNPNRIKSDTISSDALTNNIGTQNIF